MAEKDITEKILMSYGDVFADCENAMTYGGRQEISAKNLQPAPTESYYRGHKRMHNQFADVSSYLVENGQIRRQFLIGNETDLEKYQVLRKASYQGGAYRAQLEMDRPVYPVSCMIMEWSHKSARIALSLHELLKAEGAAPEDLEQVDDVKLEVHHMRNLPKEVRDRFVSDMGFVVDYLNEGHFENRRKQKIVHVEALCEMMEALTGDNRFTEQAEELLKRQREGGEVLMCEYIDMLEARGEARGKDIGEKIGKEIGKEIGETMLATLLEKLYSLGRDEDVKLAVRDKEARTRLYEEFCMAN